MREETQIRAAENDELLHFAYDALRELDEETRILCCRHDCRECPFFDAIAEGAAYPADACPLRMHIRELQRLIQPRCAYESREARMKFDKFRSQYKKDWIDNQQVFYKGFDSDLCCRGMQYEVGKTFHVEGKLELCNNGLHFCANPLEVFEHYAPNWNRFCEVTIPDGAQRTPPCETETKMCATDLKIEKELSLAEYIRSLTKLRGYWYDVGTWVSHDTITVEGNDTLFWCRSPIAVNRGAHSTMVVYGFVGISSGSTSAVVIDEDYIHATAVACRNTCVAHTQGQKCVAVAASYRAVAQADGMGSVVVAQSTEASALACADYSVAVGILGDSEYIRLEGNYCIAVSTGITVVTGQNCTVIIPCKRDRSSLVLKAVEGTTIIWLQPSGYPSIAVVGEGRRFEPNKVYYYSDIYYKFNGERDANYRNSSY